MAGASASADENLIASGTDAVLGASCPAESQASGSGQVPSPKTGLLPGLGAEMVRDRRSRLLGKSGDAPAGASASLRSAPWKRRWRSTIRQEIPRRDLETGSAARGGGLQPNHDRGLARSPPPLEFRSELARSVPARAEIQRLPLQELDKVAIRRIQSGKSTAISSMILEISASRRAPFRLQRTACGSSTTQELTDDRTSRGRSATGFDKSRGKSFSSPFMPWT